jgi:hypothetical protein
MWRGLRSVHKRARGALRVAEGASWVAASGTEIKGDLPSMLVALSLCRSHSVINVLGYGVFWDRAKGRQMRQVRMLRGDLPACHCSPFLALRFVVNRRR